MSEKLNENLRPKIGGARKGAGRKLHSKNPATIVKEEAMRQFKDRVAQNTERLFNAQMNLATGISLLFRVDKDSKGKNLPAIQVVDELEIKSYIDGEADSDSYYFITTRQPDNKAIDSMLDRTYGRAKQTIEADLGGSLNVALVQFIGEDGRIIEKG